jgi:tripartite-type tricarboxylate transporter receptor subunit TctC
MIKTILCTLLLALGNSAGAQTWPTRQIQLVVPYPPGGVVDFIGRTVRALAESSASNTPRAPRPTATPSC